MKIQVAALLFSTLVFLLSCNQENYGHTLDEEGNIVEKYQLDENDVKNGTYESYNAKGMLTEKSMYKDGIQDGLRTIYDDKGNKEIEENYANGLLNGDYKVFYGTGEVKIKSVYKNNEIQGKLTKYYASGQVMEDVSYINNEENGPFTEYWENGNKKWEGTFRNGDNEFGELLKYNEEGTLVRKLMCDSLAVCRTFWTLEPDADNAKE